MDREEKEGTMHHTTPYCTLPYWLLNTFNKTNLYLTLSKQNISSRKRRHSAWHLTTLHLQNLQTRNITHYNKHNLKTTVLNIIKQVRSIISTTCYWNRMKCPNQTGLSTVEITISFLPRICLYSRTFYSVSVIHITKWIWTKHQQTIKKYLNKYTL